MNLEVVGLRFKPAGKILQYVANELALHRGEKIELRGFGSFRIRQRGSRILRWVGGTALKAFS